MVRFCTAILLLTMATGTAQAQAPTADCSRFKRTSDGHWMSTVDAKIGNPKEFKQLQPGIPIPRTMTIVGLNVSDTLDRLCGSR